MAVTATCNQCGKVFRADDRFIGKRVRCKSCGNVFTVGAGDPGAGGGVDDDESLLSGIAEAAGGSTTSGGIPAQQASQAPQQPIGWIPPVQVFSSDEPIENRGLRRTVAFNFPLADLIDAWAPRLVVFGGLAWLLMEAMNTPVAQGPAWVPYARLGLMLLLYAAVMLPITVRGVEWAATKFRFTFPPSSGWRTFATFFFPFVLAYVLWHVSGGSIGSVILGLMTGLIVSLALFWFLFRLQPRELPMSFAYSAGSFLISALVAGAIVFGLNLLTFNIMLGMRQAHTFASSPFGPSLRWDAPPAPPPEEKKATDTAVASASGKAETKPARQRPPKPPVEEADAPAARVQTPKPRTPPARQIDPTPPAADVKPPATPDPTRAAARRDEGDQPVVELPMQNAEDDADNAPATPESSIFSGANDESDAAQDNDSVFSERGDGRAASVDGDEDMIVVPSTANERPSRVADTVDAPVIVPGDGMAGGIEVRESEIGGFDDIIFPATPSKHLALVHRDEDGDIIELWSSNPYNREGKVKLLREQHQRSEMYENYILSPDGNYLLRITQGLRMAVQVFSFAEKRQTASIVLNDLNGKPRLAGFLNNDLFAIVWQNGGRGGIETFSVSERKQKRGMVLNQFIATDANFAIRRDGQQVAFVARDRGGPVLQLMDLAPGGKGRTIPIEGFNRGIVPGGVAFGPNNKIAAVFEQGNQRVVLAWQLGVAATKIVDEVFTAGGGGVAGGNTASKVIDWTPDGSLFVVRGLAIMDGGNGSLLASTDLRDATAQRVLDETTIEVVVGSGKQKRLAIVRLDPASLAKQAGRGANRQ